jgi:hypothetical protein
MCLDYHIGHSKIFPIPLILLMAANRSEETLDRILLVFIKLIGVISRRCFSKNCESRSLWTTVCDRLCSKV